MKDINQICSAIDYGPEGGGLMVFDVLHLSEDSSDWKIAKISKVS